MEEYGVSRIKYLRVPPRKARLAAGLMRGQLVDEAARQLVACGSKGGRLLKQALESAVANAEAAYEVQRDRLKVIEVRVDEGPRLKRAKSRSRGNTHPIKHRTSHFTVVVGS